MKGVVLMQCFNKEIGNYGELAAQKYLENLGYVILDKNFRCKSGEIDIIAKDKTAIAFIEVKSRYNTSLGLPCESVTYKKQLKLYKAAQTYILKKKPHQTFFRFDVVEVVLNIDNDMTSINLIKNAFQSW
jgi:putative endonuclease